MTSETGDTHAKIKLVPSTFKLHVFCGEVLERKAIFQVLQMKDSLFIFINYKDDMAFRDLSFAFAREENMTPLSTQLIGNFTEDPSRNLCTRLSKKLKKPIYISCNLGDAKFSIPVVEKRLYQEILENPDKF